MSEIAKQTSTDLDVVAFARRHAERKELTLPAARTLILGLASKVERYARQAETAALNPQPHKG